MSRRIAFVTGGSRGIGAAIVSRLAADGADVVFTYLHSADRADALAAEVAESYACHASAVRADSGLAHELAAAVDDAGRRFGRLDVLVNNAGIFPFGAPEAFTIGDVDRALAVHARAAYVASQAALRYMSSGGRIISIGSCLVERVPVAGISLYAMSKAALTGLTKGLARDLGPRGITVNLVHPGPTDTDMNPADAAEAEAERAFTALGRYAHVNEVAAAVAYLASEQGGCITGSSIFADGGYCA